MRNIDQDGQTAVEPSGWQGVEKTSNSRDDINSNESYLSYNNQVT